MADANDSKRTCKKCLGIFPLSEFKYKKDRHNSVVCVHCFRKRAAKERKALLERNPDYFKDWRKKNPDYFKDYSKNWRKMNPGYAGIKEWRAKNPDRVRAHDKAWRARNLERARVADRVKHAKRRARSSEGCHSLSDIRKILLMQKEKCAYCKTSLGKGFHCDHIVPLSKGGTDWPDNIQILCPSCNLSKGSTDPIEFRQLKGFLI